LTVGEYWHGLPDASQIVGAAYDHDWSSNLDPLKKLGGKIFRHPDAAVGCRIPWKVTSVHTDGLAEFHVIRHRCGSKMATAGNWVGDAGR
jgi:hypothetical protein